MIYYTCRSAYRPETHHVAMEIASGHQGHAETAVMATHPRRRVRASMDRRDVYHVFA